MESECRHPREEISLSLQLLKEKVGTRTLLTNFFHSSKGWLYLHLVVGMMVHPRSFHLENSANRLLCLSSFLFFLSCLDFVTLCSFFVSHFLFSFIHSFTHTTNNSSNMHRRLVLFCWKLFRRFWVGKV